MQKEILIKNSTFLISPYKIFKRAFDIFFAYIFLLLAYIPMLVIAILIKVSSKGPVIFRQKRVGKGGHVFICYKFRTMKIDAPPNKSSSEFKEAYKYITPVGKFLRKTSLDELPQLFNVLAGEMSLIGPRPLIPHEREIHKKRDMAGVYLIRPGMSGLAQICGRDILDDEKKVCLDIEYMQKESIVLDFRIFLRTLFNIVLRTDFKYETSLESKTFLEKQ